MQLRGVAIAVQAPGRFRCLVCRTYVTGTEAGFCPHCGFVPPIAPAVPDALAPFPAWVILGLGLVLVLAVIVVVS